MDSASKALSASLYRSSMSIIEQFFNISPSAAAWSVCEMDARTIGFEEVGRTYRGYATEEKLDGSRYKVYNLDCQYMVEWLTGVHTQAFRIRLSSRD